MMHTVEEIKLKDVAFVKTGYTFRSGLDESTQIDSVRVIQPKDILDTEAFNSTKIDRALITSLDKYLLIPGDILIANKGTKFATFLYKENDVETLASSSFFIITPTIEKILPRYLQWYLEQETIKSYLSKRKTGTTIPTINKPVIENLLIPIPHLQQQQHVVDLINEVDRENVLLKRLLVKRAELRDERIWNIILNKNENS
ncbi:restriction endonuclease subunit S [Pedobacter cryoconitis]|uniref:Restriction endonuclease S subunit n=1 Tax=Pedobacter cryoconitis TaxID=188932 RepID=A0A7X0MIX8_9SPHI|nr:restriction endonuclease subunit S [Pedobacter cryoconitis]MBB6499010.1 restriction endonuclease S subunit [Pedobacter cryoconitis]